MKVYLERKTAESITPLEIEAEMRRRAKRSTCYSREFLVISFISLFFLFQRRVGFILLSD
jgi:hypothetical protein